MGINFFKKNLKFLFCFVLLLQHCLFDSGAVYSLNVQPFTSPVSGIQGDKKFNQWIDTHKKTIDSFAAQVQSPLVPVVRSVESEDGGQSHTMDSAVNLLEAEFPESIAREFHDPGSSEIYLLKMLSSQYYEIGPRLERIGPQAEKMISHIANFITTKIPLFKKKFQDIKGGFSGMPFKIEWLSNRCSTLNNLIKQLGSLLDKDDPSVYLSHCGLLRISALT